METKEFKIQMPEGYEIDKENSTFEKIVFKKIEKELPKSWEDLMGVSGYYVDGNSKIYKGIDFTIVADNRNIFPTKEEAEACLALAQLCQLRDRYNYGWKPDWKDAYERKYCIEIYKERIQKENSSITRKVLFFKTEELRDEFLENFRDLIEIAIPLL